MNGLTGPTSAKAMEGTARMAPATAYAQPAARPAVTPYLLRGNVGPSHRRSLSYGGLAAC